MEEVKLPPQFVKSLAELLQTKETNLDWAKQQASIGGLPSGWTVKDHFRGHRRSPMVEHTYYLGCDEPVADQSFALLQEAVLRAVEATTYTRQGMVSLLYFIHTIGFVYDQELYSFQQEIVLHIPADLYAEMCYELISIFNAKYHFSSRRSGDRPFFQVYEDLYRQLQYIDRMDSPVRLLVRLLKWRASNLPFIEMVTTMKPDLRVSVLEFPYDFTLDEEAFIDFLRDQPKEAVFWSTLLTQHSSSIATQYGRRIIDLFVREYWEDAGQYLFQRVYVAKATGRIVDPAKEILISSLDSFLKPQFFEKDAINTVLTERGNFVTDLFAISGWLHSQKDELHLLQINGSTWNGLLQILNCHFTSINSNLVGYVSGKINFYNIWFSDSYEPVAQISLQLLQTAILCGDEDTWKAFHKTFCKLCHGLRLLFYGSFTSQNIAKRITNHIVTLLVSFPDVDLDKHVIADRIKACILVFKDTLAVHWVRLNEREELIWNADNSQLTLTNLDLSFILERLRDYPKSFTEPAILTREMISQYSSLPWPISSL